jgi:hypothetical protein
LLSGPGSEEFRPEPRYESEMPTILLIMGWRFFFYSNEGDEPIHVHCQKAEREAKLWLDVEGFDIVEAHAFNMSPADKRTVRRVVFDNFDYVVSAWQEMQKERRRGKGA